MRIAYVTVEEILGPPNSGGIQCCNRNINLLKQAFGEENIFVCAITKDKKFLSKVGVNTRAFLSKCNKNLHSVLNSLNGRLLFEKEVENNVIEYIISLNCSIVFLEFSKMGSLQKRLPKNIKQVLFMHNIEINFIKHVLLRRPEYLLNVIPTLLSEKRAVKNADIIISLNKRDAALLEKCYKRRADIIIPITIDDMDSALVVNENVNKCGIFQLLFVGSRFPSNEHGVKWFIEKVMPHANAEFTIVGKGFEKLANKLNRKNVKIIGTVDDLSQYYNRSNAVVSPILFGDGMKVKTAEALMYGKPMFATDEALEGYEVEGQENIFRCNTSKEFIEAINSFIAKTPHLSFDEKIRTLFLEKYYTPVYVQALRELLNGKGQYGQE